MLLPSSVLAEDALPVTVHAVSGEDLTLDDGRTVRLEGIHAPDGAARAEIEKLVTGKSLALQNTSTDRYGRIAAQVFIPQDGGRQLWLQGELLRAGAAFVYPPAGDEPHLDDMLKAEAEARTARRGIWSGDEWADIPAANAGEKTGQFGFVSGKVLKAERIKNKVYLNFGADWRTDFEGVIAAHDLHYFKKARIDPLTFEGKTIRLRGWIKRDPGPVIEITHPAQIEVIPTQ